MSVLTGKTLVITGGTGSFGSTVIFVDIEFRWCSFKYRIKLCVNTFMWNLWRSNCFSNNSNVYKCSYECNNKGIEA